MDTTARRHFGHESRQLPVSYPHNFAHSTRQFPNTSTHELASVVTVLPATAFRQVRLQGRSWASSRPGVASRSSHTPHGNGHNSSDISYESLRRPGADAGVLLPAGPGLQAANSSARRTPARHSFPEGTSKPSSITQRPLETILENGASVDRRARSIRFASFSRPTEHICGEASKISAFHPPTFSPSTPTTTSPKLPITSIHPSSSSSSLSPTRNPPRPLQITGPLLANLLVALTAWRLYTFYADFLPNPHGAKDGDNPIVQIARHQDVLRSVDWVDTHNQLERQCQKQELWRERHVGYLAPLLVKERGVYVAARDAASLTGIPLRQVRRGVEACAFWVAGKGTRQRDHRRRRRRESGMGMGMGMGMGTGRTLTAAQLAVRKEWEKLARILLEDMEDLQHGGAWVEKMFATGVSSKGRQDMTGAIDKCSERYFSHLAFREERWRGWKRVQGQRGGCGRVLARIGRGLGMGLRFGVGLGEEEEDEDVDKLTSEKKSKIDWSLSLLERDSMDGEGELIREMHERHRRQGVREARVAGRRFVIE